MANKAKKFCKECGKDISSMGHRAKYCKECVPKVRKEQQRKRSMIKYNEKYKDIPDIPTCKICGMKSISLIMHINNIHKMSINDYYEKFNCDKTSVFHKSYTDKLGKAGKDNSAYNHGGKCSPFSKKFVKYEGLTNDQKEKEINKVKQKANETRKKEPWRKGNTNIDYFIHKGYSKEEAEKLLKKRQATFSKEICIEKYGEEKGLQVWKDRQEKWQQTLKSKPHEEIERINRAKTNNRKNTNISKAEKELCDILKCESQINIDGYLFDLGNNKKLIEYNGDYWHCNPKKYGPEFFHKNLKMKAKNKWKKDREKISFAENKGYEVLVIWEWDFNKNRKETIQKCKEFLYG